MIRIAATGDIHIGLDSVGRIRESLLDLPERADMLLLAGDLTQHGSVEEGKVLAGELAGLEIPMIAVLGNHDYHLDVQDDIRRALEDVGVTVLEGERKVVEVDGWRVGIGAAKGFGGGFAGACGSEFGEQAMKAFVRETRGIAHTLREQLLALDCELRIALTHYAPSKDTLSGERLEIYPFLGSYLLGEAIDQSGCHLAIHGHAHRGTELGITPGGVPVRNVARPVIQHAYRVYCLSPEGIPDGEHC